MKRKIIFIMTITITFIVSTLFLKNKVYAGIRDSKLVRNKVEGIYAVAPLSDKTHLYNLEIYKINGKTSYCIEIGKKITTEIYNSTENLKEQEALTNLSKEQLEYIKAIAYFGYEYPNHDDNKYYMAAQELIWEYLNNIDITWTNQLDINGPKINIDNYKNEINSLVKRYITPLSIPKLVTYKLDSSNVINDPNNSITFYKATSKNNQQLKILDNNLLINIGTNFVGKDQITLTRTNNYNYLSQVYNFENSQIMLSAGNLEKRTETIDVIIKGAKLYIYVKDKDTNAYTPKGQASLIDPEYELYDENNKLLYTFKIPYPGFTILTNLVYGTYYIKQTKASEGYMLNNETIEFKINELNKNIDVIEEVIKSKIEINKLYEFENNNIREPNILFEIYDKNNNLYTNITTTELGPDIVELPYGKYTIKQINTTYGYDKVKDIEITIDKNMNTNIKYNLLDKKIKNLVHITTKDKSNDKQILESNIKYKILNKETKKYIQYFDENNKEIDEFETNAQGEITIPIRLPYGEYILEQITTPKKYLENKQKIEFSLNDKVEYSYIENEVALNIDYYNEPILVTLNVDTVKEIINIKNNQFQIETKERSNIEVELYLNEELINTYKTDNTGKLVIKNLKLENYCLIDKEIKEKKCINITNINSNKVEKDIEFKKVEGKTTLIITNINSENKPIDGTTIELIQHNKSIIKNTTNKEGIILIENIPTGNYCIREQYISNKYIINKETMCFEITDLSNAKKITIINNISQKRIKVPNTLKSINKNILVFPILCIIISIATIIRRKKNDY